MTISNWIRSATASLQPISDRGSKIEAELILAHCLKVSRVWILAHPEHFVEDKALISCENLLTKRLNREPLAYLLGTKPFYGRDFLVNSDVLIPRPETEHLVEQVLALLENLSGKRRVIDIGTGSGCIAISLKLESPAAEITAVDINASALRVAKRNAETYGADINFCKHDIFEDWNLGEFNIVASNPPYVPIGAILEPEVRVFEPPEALFSGDAGMTHIERLAEIFNQMVKSGGALIFEHGGEQTAAIHKLFMPHKAETLKDLAGHDRITTIWRS